MALGCPESGRWRWPLLLSLAFHLCLGLVVWLLPVQRKAAPPPAPTLSHAGFGIEHRHKRPAARSGEEESEASVVDGSATFKNPFTITPSLAAPSAANPTAPATNPGSLPGAKNADAGSGGSKGATFFNVGTPAKRIVYVLDASSSMGKGGLWDRASREVIDSLEHLPDDTVFQVIVYNSRARFLLPAHPGWLTYRETKSEVIRALTALAPEGATVHGPAFSLALAQRPEAIFFLTDADDLTLPLLAQVASWNRHGAVIHAFELNRRDPRPGTPMQLLARQHHGEYRALGGE